MKPPDKCPRCGNEDIDVRHDVSLAEWQWKCWRCGARHHKLKDQYLP